MKECPIIFSAPMIKALLEGRKTQTRRLIKPQPVSGLDLTACRINTNPKEGKMWPGVRYHKGLKLWVRETWLNAGLIIPGSKEGEVWYRANEDDKFAIECEPKSDHPKWKPSIYMPRWASRINLEIKNVRVERLQDIDSFQVIKEGIEGKMSPNGKHFRGTFRSAFEDYWNSLYTKKPEFQWQANPWLWVIEFRYEIPTQM